MKIDYTLNLVKVIFVMLLRRCWYRFSAFTYLLFTFNHWGWQQALCLCTYGTLFPCDPQVWYYPAVRILEPSVWDLQILTRFLSLFVPCLVAQSSPTLCDRMDCSRQAPLSMGFCPGKSTRVGCHALLQRIFPTQVSRIAGRFFTAWAWSVLDSWRLKGWRRKASLTSYCQWGPVVSM